MDGKLVAKRYLQITERDPIPILIKEAQQRAGCPGDMIADPPRTQWDQLCGKEKPYPLQTIPDSLPA
jgi:hypothetical protein